MTERFCELSSQIWLLRHMPHVDFYRDGFVACGMRGWNTREVLECESYSPVVFGGTVRPVFKWAVYHSPSQFVAGFPSDQSSAVWDDLMGVISATYFTNTYAQIDRTLAMNEWWRGKRKGGKKDTVYIGDDVIHEPLLGGLSLHIDPTSWIVALKKDKCLLACVAPNRNACGG